MLSLLTLYIESSKVSKDIYSFNPLTDQDAASYLFCSFANGADENGMIDKVRREFFNTTRFISQKQVEEKRGAWEIFLENNKLNGMASVFPEENKLHLIVYGNLSVLHFRNNDQEKRLTGSYGKVQTDRIEIKKGDVIMIVLNSHSSSGFDALSDSELFPMLFADDVGKAESIMTKSPKFTNRIQSIRAKQHAPERKDYEVIINPVQKQEDASPVSSANSLPFMRSEAVKQDDSSNNSSGKALPQTRTDPDKQDNASTDTSGKALMGSGKEAIKKEETKTNDRRSDYVTEKEPEVILGELPTFCDKMVHCFKHLKVGGFFWGILWFVLGFMLVLFIMYLLMPDNEFLQRIFFIL